MSCVGKEMNRVGKEIALADVEINAISSPD